MDIHQRCEKHPSFNPKNKNGFHTENKDCLCCCGLYYAVEEIGKNAGESKFSKHMEERVVLVLTPTSFENYGHLRSSLGWHYHFDDDPSWYVDSKNHILYFTEKLSDFRLREYVLWKKWCTAQWRTWDTPQVGAVAASKKNDSAYISVGVGQGGLLLTLQIKIGMSVADILHAVGDFESALRTVPNDNPVLSNVIFKKTSKK